MKNLVNLSDDDLVVLRVALDKEMAVRGLSLTVGDYGEKLAIGYFNSTRGLPKLIDAPKGAKNVDALSRDGDRYSIKTVMKTKKTGTVYPDSDDPKKQLFEYLLIVQLSPEYQLKAIYRYSWDTFVKVRAWDKRMNAWYVPVSSKKLAQAEQVFPGAPTLRHLQEPADRKRAIQSVD